MYKCFTVVSFLSCMLCFLCCKQGATSSDMQEGIAVFNKDSLAKHIIILASDSFQGRRPFTIGETRTVDYLIQKFKNTGLEPGNGDSYFQDVLLVEITPDVEATMKFTSPKNSFNLKKIDDYVIWTENTDSLVSLANEE